MLMIALPKSASSTLLKTFAAYHEKDGRQDFWGFSFPFPSEYEFLPFYHSDFREYHAYLLKAWAVDAEFFKQHIPPTANNLFALKPYKKVVLLRDPVQTALAFRRNASKQNRVAFADLKKYHECALQIASDLGEGLSFLKRVLKQPQNMALSIVYTEEEWLKLAEFTGFLGDIRLFNEMWQRHEDSKTLIIWYNDLMADPLGVFNQMENFWELPLTKEPVTLKKYNYTR
jgi:hypothetical protein